MNNPYRKKPNVQQLRINQYFNQIKKKWSMTQGQVCYGLNIENPTFNLNMLFEDMVSKYKCVSYFYCILLLCSTVLRGHCAIWCGSEMSKLKQITVAHDSFGEISSSILSFSSTSL